MGGGDIFHREQRRGEAGEEMVEDRKTTDLSVLRESERPKDGLIAGDTNDPKCLGFHSVKPRKVRGGSTSPEGKAVLHQAADESFVCDQELRWPRKDFARRRIPSRQLALKARLEMWLSQERSWQIVRPRRLNERISFRGLLRK